MVLEEEEVATPGAPVLLNEAEAVLKQLAAFKLLLKVGRRRRRWGLRGTSALLPRGAGAGARRPHTRCSAQSCACPPIGCPYARTVPVGRCLCRTLPPAC